MTFSQSVSTVFTKYCTFSGRASRSEYWYFVLFNYLVVFIFTFLVLLCTSSLSVITSSSFTSMHFTDILPGWASVLLSIYSLVILLPSLAVSVRRLHDTGRGGGWIFINLVPFIGGIWFFILMVLPSEPGVNRFG